MLLGLKFQKKKNIENNFVKKRYFAGFVLKTEKTGQYQSQFSEDMYSILYRFSPVKGVIIVNLNDYKM